VRLVKLLLLMILIIALVAIVIQNQDSWRVDFLWMSGEMPAVILLFLTAAAGFIAGVTVALLAKHGTKQSQ